MEGVQMHRVLIGTVVAWCVTLPRPATAQQREPLSVGEVTAAPGAAASGYLRVPPAAGDNGTDIPITVVHGPQPGPVVAIVAGVHGSEYPPMLAVQVLRRHLVPRELRGSVILVHCANPPSFFARTVYYGPLDRQNLNRVFPGAADGSVSYRIADALIREVVSPADVLVDVHGGDANEALTSYAAIMLTGDTARDARTRLLGNALGFPRLIENKLPVPIPTPARYLTRAAAAMGKTSLAIESGELGRRDIQYVQPIVDGLLNLLRAASILPGRPTAYSQRQRYASNETVASPVTGVLWPRLRLGERVVKGDTLAVVTDWFGQQAAVILSPNDGVVMYQAVTPPISAGETVAAVGVPLPGDAR
jgi:predicted deacylase